MNALLPVQLEEVREERTLLPPVLPNPGPCGYGTLFFTGRSVISPDLSLQVESSTRSLSQDGREITFQF